MSKATESALGALHGAVATVLTSQLEHTVEETAFNAEGQEIPTGETVHTAAPATIAAAIKFLKDNSITCDVETDTNMGNLAEALAKKQKSSRLRNAKQAALKVVSNE